MKIVFQISPQIIAHGIRWGESAGRTERPIIQSQRLLCKVVI